MMMSNRIATLAKDLASFVARWKLVIPGSISAALLAFAGFMLSPLKQRAFDYIWPPRPMMANDIVSMRKPVLRGDRFVIRLHLVAEPGKKLPQGWVKVVAQGGGIETSDNSVADIDGNDSTKDIEFKFVAHSAGEAKMSYEYFSNQKKVAVEPVQLTISDSPAGCIPRVEDLTGCWEVQWERSFGELTLEVGQYGSLKGHFRLLNGDNGQTFEGKISGYVNGSNVFLTLNEQASGKKVVGNSVGNLLEIQDKSRLILCGAMSTTGSKPFITGGIWDANAPESKVCATANFRAFARSN